MLQLTQISRQLTQLIVASIQPAQRTDPAGYVRLHLLVISTQPIHTREYAVLTGLVEWLQGQGRHLDVDGVRVAGLRPPTGWPK